MDGEFGCLSVCLSVTHTPATSVSVLPWPGLPLRSISCVGLCDEMMHTLRGEVWCGVVWCVWGFSHSSCGRLPCVQTAAGHVM